MFFFFFFFCLFNLGCGPLWQHHIFPIHLNAISSSQKRGKQLLWHTIFMERCPYKPLKSFSCLPELCRCNTNSLHSSLCAIRMLSVLIFGSSLRTCFCKNIYRSIVTSKFSFCNVYLMISPSSTIMQSLTWK